MSGAPVVRRVVGGVLAGAATLALALAGAAGAHAETATLWACHGPAGQPLGAAPFSASATGDGGATAYAGGCSTAASSLDDGGLRAALTRPDPAAGSGASWLVPVPERLAVSQVALTRRTSGIGGAPVPGRAQGYRAETAAGALETATVEDPGGAPLDGTATFATTGGGYVRFGVSCAAPAGERCAAPSEAPAAVDVGAVAVTVRDDAAPRGAVGGLVAPASGALTLRVRATDDGLGLARAQATLDGAVVASAALGGAACADLSPSDPAVDLPLGDGCPAAVEDLPLAIATPSFPDGAHRLAVSVTDAAGNSAVLLDQVIAIDNAPHEQHATALLTLSAGDGVPGGGSGAGGLGGGPGSDANVGGAGGAGSGSAAGPACLAPRLSVFLKDKPLRVVKGVPVLRRNGRYRFSGSLTCAVRGRRVRAPAGVVVALRAVIGKKAYRKGGVVTRAGGALSAILASPTARVLEFRYTSVDGSTTRVRIRIAVGAAKAKAKHKAKNTHNTGGR